MKKKTQRTKEEEEINWGKVGILKIMLGSEEFLLDTRRQTPFLLSRECGP